MRERRRVMQAAAAAALLSGTPSTLVTAASRRDGRAVAESVADATRAVGTLIPPGRPGLIRGAVVHLGISVLCAEGLARTLPERHSVLWGTGAGLAIGVVNLGVIGRRFPAIAALPLAPQLADNAAFGAVFAAVADR